MGGGVSVGVHSGVSLQQIARKIRRDVLDMAVQHNDGHIAPAYSCVEILVALYESVMNGDDKFILSKGHACLSFYSMLRHKGFNPKISGHPDIEQEEGIACTTGSLGHGLPIGVGMAFARKFLNREGHIFVLLGDGECQEGTTWESLNIARRFKLDNLTIIVDHNKLQALDTVSSIMDERNLGGKFHAFGCAVSEVDGHDFTQLCSSLRKENAVNGAARVIIAHTVKGKGLSFMENGAMWHSRLPDKEQIELARRELS